MIARCVAVALLVAASTSRGGDAADSTRLLTQAYNASGQKLFKQLLASPGNVVLSPYSVGSVMAMALAGARGETEAEMHRVLAHELAPAEIAGANADLLGILRDYNRSSLVSFGSSPVKLTPANALMLVSPLNVSKDYVTLLQERFGAELFKNVGSAQINDWVRRQTDGKIEQLVSGLNPNDVAVLLNAIYFKARWAQVFKKSSTSPEAFSLSRSQKVEVPTMHREGDYALAVRPGYRALRLPYERTTLGMIIVLPDEIDGLNAISNRLDNEELSRLLADLAQKSELVDLAMPSFEAASEVKLKTYLQRLGMIRAFDLDRADFSGVTGLPADEIRLAIDEVAHKAIIEVSEEGTVAAAATSSTFVLVSYSEPRSFHVDRPFLFYIVDDKSGAILFQGRIADPR